MDKKTTIAGLLIVMLFMGAAEVMGGLPRMDKPKVVVGVKLVDGDYFRSDKFNTQDDMYVWGDNLDPGVTSVDIYIVKDKDWNDGESIGSYVAHKVSVNVQGGEFGPVLVWPADLTVGKYDIIANTDTSEDPAVWDEGVDALDSATTFGVAVTPELNTIALMGVGLISMIGFIGISRRRG